jgi:hypothetical protein
LRAALDWAFSPAGDASVGVALTADAVPLWMHLSLLEECRSRVEQALAGLGPEANRDAAHEMKLHAALGASLRYTKGATPEMGAPGQGPSRLRRVLMTPGISCARSGACGSFILPAIGIAPL